MRRIEKFIGKFVGEPDFAADGAPWRRLFLHLLAHDVSTDTGWVQGTEITITIAIAIATPITITRGHRNLSKPLAHAVRAQAPLAAPMCSLYAASRCYLFYLAQLFFLIAHLTLSSGLMLYRRGWIVACDLHFCPWPRLLFQLGLRLRLRLRVWCMLHRQYSSRSSGGCWHTDPRIVYVLLHANSKLLRTSRSRWR